MYSLDYCLLSEHFYYCKIASVHNDETRLASSQKYRLPRTKSYLGQLSGFYVYIGPKFWSENPENLKSLLSSSFGKQYKTSYSFANMSVGSSLTCLFHLYVPLYSVPILSLIPFTLPDAQPALPAHGHAFCILSFFDAALCY